MYHQLLSTEKILTVLELGTHKIEQHNCLSTVVAYVIDILRVFLSQFSSFKLPDGAFSLALTLINNIWLDIEIFSGVSSPDSLEY